MKMSMRTSNLRIKSQKWKVGLFSLVEDFHCLKDSLETLNKHLRRLGGGGDGRAGVG